MIGNFETWRPRVVFWTPEKIERLRMLWAAGKSARECGAALGATRNMVIGKVDRLGLKRPERPKVEKPIAERPKHQISLGLVKPKPAPSPPRLRADQPLPKSRPVSLLQLKRTHCRWPIGDPRESDFYFCGAVCGAVAKRTANGPCYCPDHARLSTDGSSERMGWLANKLKLKAFDE
jgi:GcrA cell cycle regulator